MNYSPSILDRIQGAIDGFRLGRAEITSKRVGYVQKDRAGRNGEFHKVLAEHGVKGIEVARGLGVNKATISRWKACPPDRVSEVARVTGIPAHRLRPDLAEAFSTDPMVVAA